MLHDTQLSLEATVLVVLRLLFKSLVQKRMLMSSIPGNSRDCLHFFFHDITVHKTPQRLPRSICTMQYTGY